jgi:predicted phosphate transport protein (TIGR00153 family)
MSALYEWFKSRNEETVINKTLIHMKKVLECVVEFQKALSFLLEEKNIDLAIKVFFRVNEQEHQADGIRRKILRMLSKAELNPTVRENLMHLIKRNDDVANATNASARMLIYMNHNDLLSLGNLVHEKMLEIASISVDTVKKLDTMVNKLITGEEEEIQTLGEEVNSLEHEVDEAKFAINRNLVSNHPDINPFSAIEIHNCISAMEAITDNAEEVADYLILLTTSRRF